MGMKDMKIGGVYASSTGPIEERFVGAGGVHRSFNKADSIFIEEMMKIRMMAKGLARATVDQIVEDLEND